MALLPTKQRDQVMVLVTILALSLAGAYWYFVYDPKSTELDKIAAHVDTLDRRNQQAKSELAKGTVAQIREEARASRDNLDLMRTLVPAANEVSNLVDQVSDSLRVARTSTSAASSSEPVIEGELFDTYRYRLRVSGAYNDIAQMLTNIGSLNRIVSSLNVQLLPQTNVPSPAGKQLLASTFEIQTYVVRTAPRSKPGAKPGAPGAPAVHPPVKAPGGAE